MECSQQLSSSSSEDVDAQIAHVCVVCGDAATAYRFYGASSVCYSCRIFFRRNVSSYQRFNCNSIDKTRNCVLNKVTRSDCKYDKCLSVGLLPSLVNSSKRETKEQKIIITYDVSQLEKSTSTAAIKVTPEMPSHLELDDSSFKNYALKILLQSIADVFYRSFLEPLIEIEATVISQIKEKRPIIKIQTNAVDISNDFFITSMNVANNTFFPNMCHEYLKFMSENAMRTLTGFNICILDYFPANNLLQQFKNCSRFCSDGILSTYKERFPDMERLDPVPYKNYDLHITPFAKCYEDEEFVEQTIDKFQQFLCHDEELCELILLLAIFSPANVNLCEDQLRLVKHYQQKATFMIHKHLMARRNYDNLTSLVVMTKIVACINDLNRLGLIVQHGLLKKSHDEDEFGENFNIESIDIERLEEDTIEFEFKQLTKNVVIDVG